MFMFKRQGKTARKSSASHQSDSEPRPATVSTPIGDFVCYPELTPFTEYYLFRPNHQQILLQAVKKAQAGEPVDWQHIRCYGRLMLAADKSGFKAQLLLDQEMVQETEVETLVNGTRDFLARLPRGPKGGALHVCWTAEIGGYSFT